MTTAPPLHRNAAEVMSLAALRYDVLGRRAQIGVEARAYYDDARAHAPAHDNGIVERGLNVAKYLCWEMRDALTALAPRYVRGLDVREPAGRSGPGARALSRRRGASAAVRRPPRRRAARGLPRRRHAADVRSSDRARPVTGLAIVLVFLLLAGLMIARVIPALLAVPLMAVAMAAIAGSSPARARRRDRLGAVQLAPVYATVIFGALLSRVVLQTGIAETIVAYAAEFGGDRPFVLALVLCAAVALLFTSVTGLGAIIMIGTIVLPVMLTVGVPRATAATLFLLAFGLGYILNIAQWKFYRDVFGVDQGALQGYIGLLFAIDAAVLIAFAADPRAVGARLRDVRVAGEAPRRRAAPWALAAPLLPLVLTRDFASTRWLRS